MKAINFKNSVIALVIGMFALTSCGGGSKTKDGKIDAGQVVKDELKQAKIENRFSEEAALIYMKSVGLTKTDLAPDFDYVIPEKGCYGEMGNVGKGIITFMKADSSAVSYEEFKAWGTKVYNKLASMSEDGKIIKGYTNGGEKGLEEKPLAELLPAKEPLFALYILGWHYKGTFYDIYISRETVKPAKENNSVQINIGLGLQKHMTEKDWENAAKQVEKVLKK
ncbi:MAG: hypothetical protein LBH58_05835 [Tannerellaceae bacterium]|jgi:hypothetical protein|nr:hypothetical protein [Tannerellaceae bacterium]